MKGITAHLLEIILMLLTIVLIFVFIFLILGYFDQGKKTASMPPKFSGSKATFDYTPYVLSSNPVDLTSYDSYNSEICKKLKNALKFAVMTGRPYKVDEIAYGSDLYTRILFNGNNFPFIGNCAQELIETKIANGLNESVCNFNTITTNQYDSQSLASPYGGVSDSTELSFDNCLYRKISYNSLFSSYTGPDETLNHASDIVNLFYSPDYLYIRNGDYSHYDDSADPPSIVNVNAFNNAYNGPGRLQIYVGDAHSINGECTFNIYFCPRPAIALSIDNSSIDIFDIFKGLEISGLRFNYRPYYISDLSDSASAMRTVILLPHLGFLTVDFTKKVYYWNYYDVDLDGEYNVETILNAIKEGFYLNMEGKNYFFAQPHWDISRDRTLYKSGECWNPSYDDVINSADVDYRTRSIRFNCGDDNICSDQVRIKIALRLDNVSQNIDGKDEELSYISGFISFCDVSDDFIVTVNPDTDSIALGESATPAVNVGGFSPFPVSLSVSGCPTGATCLFSIASRVPSFDSTLTIANAPLGTHILTITGINGTTTHSATYTLTVNPAAAFTYTMSVSPSSATVIQGVAFSKTATVTVTKTGGTAQPVSLSLFAIIPGSVVGSLNPWGCTPDPTCNSTFTVSGTATSIAFFPIYINGTSAGSPSSTATTVFTLIVNSPIPCTCSDLTPCGQCAVTDTFKPYFCDNRGNWVTEQCNAPHNCPCPPSRPLCNPLTGACKACTCSDGTQCGQCSQVEANKPKWCDLSGYWVSDQCGASHHNCPCPGGTSCDTDGACRVSCTCSDGTPCGQCAITEAFKPYWCDNNGIWLTNACIAPHICQCPSASPICKPDGTCRAMGSGCFCGWTTDYACGISPTTSQECIIAIWWWAWWKKCECVDSNGDPNPGCGIALGKNCGGLPEFTEVCRNNVLFDPACDCPPCGSPT